VAADIHDFSAGLSAGGTSITFAHSSSGSDRVLYVFVLKRAADTITGVTYNSDALTSIATITSPGNILNATLWRLIAPDSGSFNVVVSSSSGQRMLAHAVSLFGVDQTTPNGTVVTAAGASQNPVTHPSATVSCSATDFVIAAAALQNDDNTSTLTASGGTTQMDTNATSNGTNNGVRGTGAYLNDGSTSRVMSFTADGTDDWCEIALAVKPAAAAAITGSVVMPIAFNATTFPAPVGARAGNILTLGAA
jgi:hypothetical protein